MSNFDRKIMTIAIAISVTVIYSDRTQAQTEKLLQQIEQYSQSNRQNLEQETNVNQLQDVSPTDWSYEALRSLSDRYNCVSGFPDGTYKGNQPITRNEFAAGLNACLEQIERSANNESSIIQEDYTENELADAADRLKRLRQRIGSFTSESSSTDND